MNRILTKIGLITIVSLIIFFIKKLNEYLKNDNSKFYKIDHDDED